MVAMHSDVDDFAAPLDASEVAALIATGPRALQRDGKKLMSLLRRMQVSLERHKRQSLAYERHLTELSQAQQRTGGRPTTLNPLDAARFLDDAQKELLFDAFSREQLRQLRHLIQQAQSEREVVSAQLKLVRDAGAAMMGLPQLPPAMRADIAALLGGLPLEAADVTVPGMLELPEKPAQSTPSPPLTKSEGTTGGFEAETAEEHVEVNEAAQEEVPVYVDPYAPIQAGNGVYRDPYG